MLNRQVLACLVTLALALLATGAGCGGSQPSESSTCGRAGDASAAIRKPNVVVVLTDDQDAASARKMPGVQRDLACAGTSFENFFTTYPECCPSRATLLTGQYAHNHGVLSNDPPDGGFGAFDDRGTLPVWLRAAGYRTGWIGKYLNGYGWSALGNSPTYVPPGWDDWRAFTNHTEYQVYDYDLNENGAIRHYGSAERDYSTDVLARKAKRFVAASAGRRPFFLAVAPLAPHDEGVLEGRGAPRNPRPAPRDLGAFAGASLPQPRSFNERDVSDKPSFVRRRPPIAGAARRSLTTLYRSRMESLLAVDRLVKGLVSRLRRAGELRRTVFVFTSDNGFLLGQHRLVGKDVIYDESARVPLIVRGPGFPAGVSRDQLVANVDLAATIAGLAHAQPTRRLDGTSLLRPARDPDAGRSRSLLLEVLAAHEVAALRTPKYLFARYADGERELYDLREDRTEMRNVAGEPAYARVERSLESRLSSARDCAGRACVLEDRAGRGVPSRP